MPPVQGPNSTAKVAGTNTCGQNLTPNTGRGKATHSSPTLAYRAALIPVVANLNEKGRRFKLVDMLATCFVSPAVMVRTPHRIVLGCRPQRLLPPRKEQHMSGRR